MTGTELLELLRKAKRRSHVIGTPENGIIVGLDIEGWLFTVLNGQVINRVVPSAFLNHSNKSIYHNPGGDALWPDPEGTCFGYEYGIGKWRVPPAITWAVWEVEQSVYKTVIRAEIDLVNNLQIGIPCEFERHIEFECRGKSLIQNVSEMIRYIGVKTLDMDEFSVKRNAGPLPSGQNYIDIADAPPEQFPSDKGVKLSISCDPSGFMEIEACGGRTDTLVPGTELSVSIMTEYTQHSVSIN